MTARTKEAADDELSESLAKAKKQSSAELTGSQNVRNHGLQSIVKEFQQGFTAEQKDSALHVGKHSRKPDKLAPEAIDEFHANLVGAID